VGRRFVVVGGGITGLAAALRLRELGGDAADITLVEGSSRLGGKLHTGDVGGRLCERGAEMFLIRDRDEAALALVRRVGLAADVVHPAALPAAVVVGGTMHELPRATLFGVPSDQSTVESIATVPLGRDADRGSAVLVSAGDVAVGTLVRDRFGDEVVDHLVDPLLGGVYAGRADELSLQATMPGLYETASQHRTLASAVRAALAAAARAPGAPVFASVRGGLSRLVESVAAAGRARLYLGKPARRLGRTGSGWEITVSPASSRSATEVLAADGVVLAVASRPAARLLVGVSAEAATAVGALDYASVGLVALAFPPAITLPNLSGFLVPAGQGYETKAVTLVTTKWPHLYREDGPVVVRMSFGRHHDSQALRLTDQGLAQLAHRELAALLKLRLPEPLDSTVSRWGGSLPQYSVGHVPRVAQARAMLPTSLALAGAAFDGVGIAACVRSGTCAADAVWAGTV
jgi:protoporphyrinogen/coproporphyrinogen III oxidase